jgi:hypothetical protein
MSERVTIRIIPPDDGRGELTVQDAMRQILDAFELLTAGDSGVTWRLVSASTNSPLTVVAESEQAVSAAAQKHSFRESLAELRAGRFPQAWKRPELAHAASAFLARSADSLARTEFAFDELLEPIVIERDDAAPFTGLEIEAPLYAAPPVSNKRQIGSVQGTLIEVTSYYGRPAIRIEERKTGREITCALTAELAERFSDHASVQDVWNRRRVTVRGVIFYQAIGRILRIEATAVDQDPSPRRPLPPLRDPDFTSGLSAAEYLERFRAGELG